jgi:ribosomal protein L3
MKGIIGKKVGMTQVFDEKGLVTPVTVIQAGPCYVTQVRTSDRDGYTAIQLGFEETKPQRLTKGQLGHLKRNNLPALRYLREFRIKNGEMSVEEGQKITVNNALMWWAPAKVVASPARLSATTLTAGPRRTASLTVSARPAPSAPPARLAVCIRACVWRAGWATTA